MKTTRKIRNLKKRDWSIVSIRYNWQSISLCKFLKRETTEAEFKEFGPRLEFETRLKYGWFHLKLYSMFQDLGQRSIETGFWRIWDGGANSLNLDSEKLYQALIANIWFDFCTSIRKTNLFGYLIEIQTFFVLLNISSLIRVVKIENMLDFNIKCNFIYFDIILLL